MTLQRKTRLRAYTPLRRKKPLRARPSLPISSPQPRSEKRKNARPACYVDEEYLAWLRTQPCRLTGQRKHIVAHHARHDEHGASLGRNIKDDRRAISLTWQVHQDRHAGTFFFRGMVREQIHAWENHWIAFQRAKYLAWKAAREAGNKTS
jgi:hypothetical protein